MLVLHYASSSLTGTATDVSAVDVESNSISILIREEPPQLDSSRATDAISGMVLGHVMEGLVRMGMDGRLEGAVAKDWEVTPTTATFWLREDAKWSDGRPVTAAACGPDRPGPLFSLAMLRGASARSWWVFGKGGSDKELVRP